MDYTNAVIEISKALQNNRLVIFVGAGVSRNSGIPTWGGLIEQIASQIGYEKKKSYSQDEFLRIPEYFFQSVSGDNYYSFIVNSLSGDTGPNAIDDVVFDLLPHHIITTNYDSLLERSTSPNAKLFSVVAKDSDLLLTQNDRYIVKMHGDLSAPESIILKESDYINYEQTHPLITTFIRSLLINHVFLFIGYSLNDYNLNLIIGWINYYRKEHAIHSNPMSYLAVTEGKSSFEAKRLESYNISVLDLSETPESVKEKISVPSSLTYEGAKLLYILLRSIEDSDQIYMLTNLNDYLKEKSEPLFYFRRVSYKDMKELFDFGFTRLVGGTLVFKDKSKYDFWVNLLSKGIPCIISLFSRSGILKLAVEGITDDYSISAKPFPENCLFDLYLQNRYSEIKKILPTCDDLIDRIYYGKLCGEEEDSIISYLDREASFIKRSDNIPILLNKTKRRWATITMFDKKKEQEEEIEKIIKTMNPKELKAISFLRALTDQYHRNIQDMGKLLDRQKAIHDYNSTTVHFGPVNQELLEIQSYAYEYYFFFKINGLPLDTYIEPKRYLGYYIQSILCSYLPISKGDSEFGIFNVNRGEAYSLNDVDFDIVVKFSTPKDLLRWIKNYRVERITLNCSVDITIKIDNLLNSINDCQFSQWYEYLYNLTIVLCHTAIDKEKKEKTYEKIILYYLDLIENNNKHYQELESCFNYVSINIEAEQLETSVLEKIIQLMANSVPNQHYYGRTIDGMQRLLRKYRKCIPSDSISKLMAIIEAREQDDQKLELYYLFRFVISSDVYVPLLYSKHSLLAIGKITTLILEGRIRLNTQLYDRYIEEIKKEVEYRKMNPGLQTYPDHLSLCIESCILFDLIGQDIDLTKLSGYEANNMFLKFILSPDTFDYALVDLKNYMWQNLIYSTKYKEYFRKHKTSIISAEIHNVFRKDLANSDQQKIVYGILLDNSELRGFPPKE